MNTFTEELKQVESLTGYTFKKELRLDDLASAYLNQNTGALDESFKMIKKMRKALRMKGYTLQEINDFLLERSYLTKTQINRMFNDSIYNEDNTVKNVVECIPFHVDYNTTDMIIEELKTRPALIKALKKGMKATQITRDFRVKNATLLKSFYKKYEAIIEE